MSPALMEKTKTLKGQLIQMQLIGAIIVLFVCSCAFIVNDYFILQKSLKRNIETSARILGKNLLPTLAFADKEEARKILASLSAEPDIDAAYLFDETGKLFAHYGSPLPASFSLPENSDRLSRYAGGEIQLFHQLTENKETIGLLILKGRPGALRKEFKAYALIVSVVVLAGLFLSFILATYLQYQFSGPMAALVQIAKRISNSSDYSLRIGKVSKQEQIEEIKVLSQEFNRMIEKIQDRDRQINSANQDLEHQVEIRTQELKEAQKIALQNAHAAGMSEISTGILHNIGNIVNSANVSIEEMIKITQQSKLKGLRKINSLLEEEKNSLGQFLTTDPKGKLIPEYLQQVTETLTEEQRSIREEIDNLVKKVVLIKDVVGTQQVYARGDIMREEIDLASLIREVLEMQRISLGRHSIKVISDFHPIPHVSAQKIKLSHILLNLFKNAKESMDHASPSERKLKISTRHLPDVHQVHLSIEDTGEGITQENLKKVFQHGFTTKKHGHGFGLHFCANAMTEMNGELQVSSNGVQKGAKFTLIFNLNAQEEKAAS